MHTEIYPPRPKVTVPPTLLSRLEAEDRFVAQPKFEESRALFRIPRGKDRVTFSSRQGREHRKLKLSPAVIHEILSLPGLDPAKEYLLDGGVFIRTPGEDTKDKVVFFDVLHCGEYLFLKMNQMERLKLLDTICGSPREFDPWRKMAYQISDNLLLSPHYTTGFLDLFNKDCGPEVEGVLLRERNSFIDNFGAAEYEVPWMVRCRRPQKHSPF